MGGTFRSSRDHIRLRVFRFYIFCKFTIIVNYIYRHTVHSSMDGKRIQDTVREVCSLSYVSGKMGISRPTLYKYMELYDSGETDRIPDQARSFFDYMSRGGRSEDDVMLYFLRGRPEEPSDETPVCAIQPSLPTSFLTKPVPAPPAGAEDLDDGLTTACIRDGDRLTILFRDAFGRVDETVVEFYITVDGEEFLFGEFRPDPGMRFVRVDPPRGCTCRYRVRQRSGGKEVVSRFRDADR